MWLFSFAAAQLMPHSHSAAMFAGLVAAHALGRASAVATMLVLPPATEHGLGASHSHRLRTGPTALGVAAAVAAVAALTGWWVAPLLAVALVGSVAVGWMAMRKIGGLVGDVLGAIEQVVECGVLAGIAFDELGRARGAMGVDVADFDGTGRPSLAVGNF